MFDKPPSRHRSPQENDFRRRLKADGRDVERDEERTEPRLSRDPAPPREAARDRTPRADQPRRERSLDFDRAEPSLWRAPSGAAGPDPASQRMRLVAERDPARARAADERWSESGHKRRHTALWMFGGALVAAAAAAVFVYAHQSQTPADIMGTSASPQASLPTTALQPVIAVPSAPTPAPAPQKMESDVITPPRAATVLPPIETPPPRRNLAAVPPPAAPAAKAAPPATNEAEAAPKRAAAAAGSPTPPASPLPRRTANDGTRNAQADLAPKPTPKRIAPTSPPATANTAAPRAADLVKNAAADKGNDDSVSVDGTSYIAGREPHALGSLTTHTELASTPGQTQAAPSPPALPAGASSTPDKLRGSPLPPNTDFAITPAGIMTPSGVVTPFNQQ